MVEAAVELLDGNGPLDDFENSWTRAGKSKSLSSQISNHHIDEIYNAAKEAGVLGGKLLGAGGGGLFFFVKPEFQSKVKEKLKNLLHVPFKFENLGSQIVYYGQGTEF